MELKTYSFKIIAQKEKCLLLFDRENRLLELQEKGCVNLNTAKELRILALSLIEDHKLNKLLLNRKWLQEYTKDARNWIIKNHYTSIKNNLDEHLEMIATVKPIDSIGAIYSHLLSNNIKISFPRISMIDFDKEADAMGWLLKL